MDILAERRVLILFGRSIALAAIVTFVSLVIGLPMAIMLSRIETPLRSFFRAIYLLPVFIPPHINTISWMHLLGHRGFANKLLMNWFRLDEPPINIYGFWGVVFVLTLCYFPYVTFVVISGLERLDAHMEEAGRLCTHPLGVLLVIALPLVMPSILSGALLVFILALSNFGVPALLEVNVFPVEIFTQFSARFDFGAATATALLLVMLIVLAVLFQRWYTSKKSYQVISGHFSTATLIDIGNWQYICLGFCLLVMIASVFIPIGMLLLESFSFEAYRTAFSTASQEIKNSLWLAALGATGIVGLGLLLAYAVEKARFWGRGVFDVVSVMPYAVGGTVLGIGLIKLWNQMWLFNAIYGTSLMIVLGYMARFAPFAIRPIAASLKQIKPTLEEAAALSGASWLRTLLRVVIPLSASGLVTAWGLSFIFCMGELDTTILIYPPGSITLPVRIFTLIHYGQQEVVAGLCVILIVLTLLPLLLLERLAKRVVSFG
jgi:iron(III) transport system permease protein